MISEYMEMEAFAGAVSGFDVSVDGRVNGDWNSFGVFVIVPVEEMDTRWCDPSALGRHKLRFRHWRLLL